MDVKTERPGIYRGENGLLVNKDLSALASYKARKQQSKKINEVESDIKDLKTDMAEIKELIKRFLSK